MVFALVAMGILCGILIIYLIGIKLQLRNIRRQLEHRQKERSEGMITLELQDQDLKEMTVALNQTLKQETDYRRSQNMQENEFKNLITNISHDLRTPLTVMKGYLQLLERCEIDTAGRDYLAVCFRHTDELEYRIHQFFEYSYWMNQEQEISLHPVNVTNLIADTMTDFVPVFEEKGLSMRLEKDVIWKAMADEELLKRVMQNLLKNCLQYAVGEVRVSVTEERTADLEGNESAERVRVCVGNPIADDSRLDASAVFQRFYVEQEARNQSTGLGLSIVKLLVESMQGEVFAAREGNWFSVGFLLKKHIE
ncbi:MAG: HAMP domain-containing histidine kinase [Lachnospiraceae bacterium]|nr:HAMP domain-containing histidine kinase [Lachnospiraceae bacterium]